jgi:hypothetical protein
MTLTDEDKHWIEAANEESSKRFEHQFTNLIQSLDREMVAGLETVNDRADLKAGRLERQTLLWETGRRWSYGIDTWAAKIEADLETKDRPIADLARRIDEPDGKERLPMTP